MKFGKSKNLLLLFMLCCFWFENISLLFDFHDLIAMIFFYQWSEAIIFVWQNEMIC